MGNRDRRSQNRPAAPPGCEARRLVAVALCAGAGLGARRRSVVRGASRSTSSTRRSPTRASRRRRSAPRSTPPRPSSPAPSSRRSSPLSARPSSRQCSPPARSASAGSRARSPCAKGQLAVARAHLRHSLNTLSARLVDIYRGGMPDADHAAPRGGRHGRPRRPAPSTCAGSRRPTRRWCPACARCATRSPSRLAAVEDAQRRAHEFNEQIAAARDQISAVRAQAEARAQQLQALRAQRQAAIDSLQSQVSGWTSQVQRLERISAQQAQGEVDKWFGDWAIPESIVQCESGGNFGAVNPSLGRRRRVPDPPLDLGPLRRPRRPSGRLAASADQHRRADLGGLGLRGLGVRSVAR